MPQLLENCSNITSLVRKQYFDLANEENGLKIKFSVYIDNFEQYVDTSLLIAQDNFQIFEITLKVFILLKNNRLKLSVISRFSNIVYCIERKPWNTGNQQKALESKGYPLLIFVIIRKLLKTHQFGM